jgi:hypothetical protein
LLLVGTGFANSRTGDGGGGSGGVVVRLLSSLRAAFRERDIPVRVARVRVNPTVPPSAHAEVGAMFTKVDMLLVRPDHVISWCFRSSEHPALAEGGGGDVDAMANNVVSVVSGRFAEENEDVREVQESNEAEESYLRWIRKEFIENLKPCVFPQLLHDRHNPPTLPHPPQPTNITSTVATHQHHLNRRYPPTLPQPQYQFHHHNHHHRHHNHHQRNHCQHTSQHSSQLCYHQQPYSLHHCNHLHLRHGHAPPRVTTIIISFLPHRHNN